MQYCSELFILCIKSFIPCVISVILIAKIIFLHHLFESIKDKSFFISTIQASIN